MTEGRKPEGGVVNHDIEAAEKVVESDRKKMLNSWATQVRHRCKKRKKKKPVTTAAAAVAETPRSDIVRKGGGKGRAEGGGGHQADYY